jgi:hypothetical protein
MVEDGDQKAVKGMDSEESRKLNATLDLMGLLFDLRRQRLRREHPTESEEEIAVRFQAWLLEPKKHATVPERYLKRRRAGRA